MSATRTAGVAGTFPVTFSQVPVETPTLTMYADPARTVLAVPTTPLAPTANPATWTASYPATLAAGTYYLVVAAVYTAGQPAVLDQDDTLVLTDPQSTVGGGLVTLEQARAQLNIDPDDHSDDAELGLYLEAVTPLVEERIGPVLPRTVTETLRGSLLRQAPVLAVQAVQRGSVAVTAYTLEAGVGRLRGAHLDGATVTYTVGRDPIPAAIKLAALIIVAHLWETQRGSQPLPLAGGLDDDPLPANGGFAIPRRALQLLAPYARGARVV